MVMGMTHNLFVKTVKARHDATIIGVNKVQQAIARVTGGTMLVGGAYGMLYESVFVHQTNLAGDHAISSPGGAVTDLFFPDFNALVQLKAHGGSQLAAAYYNGGKTVKKTRGEAVKDYCRKVAEQFEVHPDARYFYLSSYNSKANSLAIYYLAERKGRKITYIDDYIHYAPNGWNPKAKITREIHFHISGLRLVARYP
jgi:hypothetical protein